MNVIYKDLIYMLYCAVNGITPDTARVQTIDLEKLYRLAKKHSLRGAVCIALERADIYDKAFYQAYNKAIRKNVYLDMERAAIISEFEKQGIWYMPLKGAVLQELYPENGMREMSDNDILFDAGKQMQTKEIMLSRGYSVEDFAYKHQDVYHKPPVLNIELHTALFGTDHAESLCRYYADVKRLLRRDGDNKYGYHFSDEDFYVYITAHEWKHYSMSGTGIRSLLDCYVYCKARSETLDWKYITEQCQKLEIADFEQKRRQLAVKVFSSETLPELTKNELDMLMCYLSAGTYGTYENEIKHTLKGQTKASFILHQVFPDLVEMKRSVKFVNKYPVLYPVGLVYRWGRILVKRRDRLSVVLKVMKKHDN